MARRTGKGGRLEGASFSSDAAWESDAEGSRFTDLMPERRSVEAV